MSIIRQVNLETDRILLEKFFLVCNNSDEHTKFTPIDSIFFRLENESTFRAFANFSENEILSLCLIKEIEIQKSQFLEMIFTKKGISLQESKIAEVTDFAVQFGEDRGIFRFYTIVTDKKLLTFDLLHSKNKVFYWRSRYDTYIDEIVDVKNFSNYEIHWNIIMKGDLKPQKKNIRHHILKPNYIKEFYERTDIK